MDFDWVVEILKVEGACKKERKKKELIL